ncbi:unnamed protein product [Closterium sp. NIES-54]
MRPGDDVKLVLDKIKDTYARMAAAGSKVSQMQQCTKIISVLDNSWDNLIPTLNTQQDQWKPKWLRQQILQEDFRRRHTGGGAANKSAEGYGAAGGSRGRGGGRGRGRGRGFGRGRGRGDYNQGHGSSGGRGSTRMDGACWYCKKAGHPWFKCFSQPEGWAPPGMEPPSGERARGGAVQGSGAQGSGAQGKANPGMFLMVEDVKGSEGDVGSVGKVVMHPLTHWVIDSGCTSHMTPRADLLDEDQWTPEWLRQQILQEDFRRRHTGGGAANKTAEGYGAAGGSSGRGGGRGRGRGRGFGRGRGRGDYNEGHGSSGGRGSTRMEGACWYCKKAGHPWFKCFSRPEGWAPPGMKPPSGESARGGAVQGSGAQGSGAQGKANPGMFLMVEDVKGSEGDVGSVGKVVMHPLTHWVIDSGCTSHMTPRADLLDEVKPPGKIKFVAAASGALLPVIGVGNAKVMGANGGLVGLGNVLLVEGLSANLLSVRRLQKIKAKVTFGPTSCCAKLGKLLLWDLEEKSSCIKDLWQLPIIPWNGKPPATAAAAATAKATTGGEETAPTDGALDAVKKVQQSQQPHDEVLAGVDATAAWAKASSGNGDADWETWHERLCQASAAAAATAKATAGAEETAPSDGAVDEVKKVQQPQQPHGEVLAGVDATAAWAKASSGNGDADWETWHERLCHINIPMPQKLVKDGSLKGLEVKGVAKEIGSCPTCLETKFTKFPFSSSTGPAKAPLTLVHMDVVGPTRAPSLSGSRYFLTIVDDHMRAVWVYPLKTKGEVAAAVLKEWMPRAQRESGHKLTVPYNPQQNGVAERFNRTLQEGARTLLGRAGLPDPFWVTALRQVALVKNTVLATVGERQWIPYTKWYGSAPAVNMLRAYGCMVVFHVPKEKRGKLEASGRWGVHLGLAKDHKGWLIWDLTSQQLIVSKDVKFLESLYYKEWKQQHQQKLPTTLLIIEADEVQRPSRQVQVTVSEDEISGVTQDGGEPEPKVVQAGSVAEQCDEDEIAHCYWAAVPEPKTLAEALSGPDAEKWKQSVKEEYDSLLETETWELCELPPGKKAISSKPIFRHKYGPDGELTRYKLRLVAKGFQQTKGKDFDEIFAPVRKGTTLRVMLGMAANRGWRIKQMDITTAFLNGIILEELYMLQPEGLDDGSGRVCRLKKAIYGLKQAPRAWYHKLEETLLAGGFKKSECDHSLFLLQEKEQFLMLLVYVDDILLFSESSAMIEHVEEMLEMQFKCSKMGDIKYYLGMHVERDLDKGVLRLHQRKYCEGLAEKYGLQDGGKPATPLPSGFTVEPCADEEVVGESDRKLFHSMVGALNYVANHTRPDIAFATSRLASVVSRPSHEQLETAKRLVRYRGAADLSKGEMLLTCYTDASFNSVKADGTSIGGYVCLFGGGAVTWRSKKQNEVGLSSCETEYMALHHGWLTRDIAARLAIRNHLPLAECAHFGHHRTVQALYDAVVVRYSSPATAALGCLLLPYLFPELSAFATVEDLVSHLRASDARYRAAAPTEDHFLSLEPTSVTIDLLEQYLLAGETSAVAVGSARGTPPTPFFEGCSPSPLAPSYASATALDVLTTEDVGAASASAKRCSTKGKGGRGGGGGSGSGGWGSSGGSGGSGGGGNGGSGGGSRGVGGGGGGSGGSGSIGSGGSGGGKPGA